MAVVRLKYVHAWHDKKTGRTRYYFRYRGPVWRARIKRVRLCLRRPVSAACAKLRPAIAYPPATLGGVIEKYLASGDYQAKSRNTQRVYRRVLDRLKEIAGRGLIADLREHHVREIRKRFLPATERDCPSYLVGVRQGRTGNASRGQSGGRYSAPSQKP
jgi:hypothetical protein